MGEGRALSAATISALVVGVPGALVLLVLGAVLLDRGCARRAERSAAAALRPQLGDTVTVRVRGRPFLAQALHGRYRQIDVVGTVPVGQLADAALVAHLTNAYLPWRDALAGRVEELPCEHVEGRLLLPYDGLARAAHIPGLTLAFEGERLLATATLPPALLPLPGLGPLTRISGRAVLTLGGGGSVWLRIRGVSIAGIAVPSVLLNQLLPALEVRIPLPPLPFGLRLDQLTPTASGLVVDGSADAVVLRRPAPAPLPDQPPRRG